MKKKFICMLSVCLLLGGCGSKVPTADELVANAWGSEQVESIDMNVNLDIDLSVDTSSMIESTNTSDADKIMGVQASLDADVKSNASDIYMEGTVNASVAGMSFSQPLKTYVTTIDDKRYEISWNDTKSAWYKNENSNMFSLDSSVVSEIDTSIFDSYALMESKKDDTEYRVNGIVSFDKLTEKLSLSDEMLAGLGQGDIDTSNIKFGAEMLFDKETELCKSIKFSFNPNSLEDDSITINKCDLIITIKKVNGVDITVPQDVLDSCIESEAINESTEEVTEEITEEVTEEVTEEITEETSGTNLGERQTLAQYLIGVDYAYSDDIEDILLNYYDKLPDEDVIWSFTSLLNSYDINEFIEYLGSFSTWEMSDKIALAIMADTGLFDVDDLAEYGVDAEELQNLIVSLVELHN